MLKSGIGSEGIRDLLLPGGENVESPPYACRRAHGNSKGPVEGGRDLSSGYK